MRIYWRGMADLLGLIFTVRTAPAVAGVYLFEIGFRWRAMRNVDGLGAN